MCQPHGVTLVSLYEGMPLLIYPVKSIKVSSCFTNTGQENKLMMNQIDRNGSTMISGIKFFASMNQYK